MSTSWRGIFEGPKTIIAVLNEAALLVFDDYTKERCIAAFLLAKRVYLLRRKSVFLLKALYLKQCAFALQKAYASSNQKTPRISHPFRVPNDYSILP